MSTRLSRRNKSRNCKKIESLNPCVTYSDFGGHHPFAHIIRNINMRAKVENMAYDEISKQEYHKLKMKTDQKSAKARSQRKRNKV